MVGIISAVGFVGFIGSTIVVESRPVDSSLARSRVYRTQMGHYYYAMSLGMQNFTSRAMT